MMVYTFVLCLLLQARIGGVTIEERFQEFAYRSKLAGEAREVAEGALRFIGAQTEVASGVEITERLPGFSKKIQSKVKSAIKSSEKNIGDKIKKYSDRDSVRL